MHFSCCFSDQHTWHKLFLSPISPSQTKELKLLNILFLGEQEEATPFSCMAATQEPDPVDEAATGKDSAPPPTGNITQPPSSKSKKSKTKSKAAVDSSSPLPTATCPSNTGLDCPSSGNGSSVTAQQDCPTKSDADLGLVSDGDTTQHQPSNPTSNSVDSALPPCNPPAQDIPQIGAGVAAAAELLPPPSKAPARLFGGFPWAKSDPLPPQQPTTASSLPRASTCTATSLPVLGGSGSDPEAQQSKEAVRLLRAAELEREEAGKQRMQEHVALLRTDVLALLRLLQDEKCLSRAMWSAIRLQLETWAPAAFKGSKR